MICERFSFIIICSVLSNITINSSWTTTSNVPQAHLLQDVAVVSLNQNSAGKQEQLTRVQTLEHHDQIAESKFENPSEAQLDKSSNSTSSESTPEVNRFWFLVAIAATSTVYLCLLWILFKKPLPKNEVSSTSAHSNEQSDKEKVIDDVPSFDSVKDEEIISSQVHSEIDQRSQINLPQDEGSLAAIDMSKDMSKVEKAYPRGNLVKIDSDQNYIDVGFELLQDLQQSDRNTRRKAIWELAKIGDSRCIEPLMAIMPQANPVDKSLILKAVTQVNNRSFKPVNKQLFASLKDANPQMRINTILDLTAFYKFVAPINQQLTQMQLDPDPEVRHRAQQALEKLNVINFPAAIPIVNNYPGNSSVNQQGKMTSEDKANQI